MKDSNLPGALEFVPAVYFAESFVRCEREKAWPLMLDYTAWNPNLVGVRVTPLEGAPGVEGERVLLSAAVSDPSGISFPDLYCETVKVVPGRRIVWYSYAKEGHTFQNQQDPFRNFVDMQLTEEAGGVRFSVAYYAQSRLSAELIAMESAHLQSKLERVAPAFRDYCERAR